MNLPLYNPPVISQKIGEEQNPSCEFKIPAKLYNRGEVKSGEFILKRIDKQVQVSFSDAGTYNYPSNEWQRALNMLCIFSHLPIVINMARSSKYFGWSEDEEESEKDFIFIVLDIGTVQFKKSARPDLIRYLEVIIRETMVLDVMAC